MSTERFILGQATGLSMWPTLRPGDILIVDRDVRQLRVGDIVIFGDIVHRLIWIDPFEDLWERGDGASSAPRRRHKREVRGRVKAVIRDGVFITLPSHRPSLTSYVLLALSLARRVKRLAKA